MTGHDTTVGTIVFTDLVGFTQFNDAMVAPFKVLAGRAVAARAGGPRVRKARAARGAASRNPPLAARWRRR